MLEPVRQTSSKSLQPISSHAFLSASVKTYDHNQHNYMFKEGTINLYNEILMISYQFM